MDANRVWNCYLDVHHGGAIWWFSTESGDWFYESTGSKMPPPTMVTDPVWDCYKDVDHGGAIWWFSTKSGDWFYKSTRSQMVPPTKVKLGGDETSDDMTVTTDTPHDDADSTPDSETTTTYTLSLIHI